MIRKINKYLKIQMQKVRMNTTNENSNFNLSYIFVISILIYGFQIVYSIFVVIK